MELKRLDNTNIDNEQNSIKTVKDSYNSTFLETLNQSVTKATSTKSSSKIVDALQNDSKTIGIPTIDKLNEENKKIVIKNINTLNTIFDIDILQNRDEFFNSDSQIKIRDILDNYGDKVTSNDLIALSKTINTLLENGMISDSDYFYALKWIAEKQEIFRVKLQMEKTKSLVNDLMFKQKKS